MKAGTKFAVAGTTLALAIAPTVAGATGGGNHGNSGNAPGHSVSAQHRQSGNGNGNGNGNRGNNGNGNSNRSNSDSNSNGGKSHASLRSTAGKQCRAALSSMGRTAFDQLYGSNKNTRNAFGKCVSKQERQDAADQAAAKTSAEQSCRSERSSDPSAFDKKYGTNGNGRNAFGKCVSRQEKEDATQTEDQQLQTQENAAKTCRAEQASDPAAFQKKYGTNHNGRNAFGKCVSEHAKTQEQTTGSGSTTTTSTSSTTSSTSTATSDTSTSSSSTTSTSTSSTTSTSTSGTTTSSTT